MNTSPGAPHVPHAPLTAYYANEQERHVFLRKMFDDTAQDYDRMEAILGLGSGSRYRRDALKRAGLQKGMSVLDVATGTGLVAAQACIITGDPALVTGVDPSPGMMAANELPHKITMLEGRAEALPFPDNHFDFLSMGYALRHITDLDVVFREFRRVLKPGGRVCIMEISQAQSAWGRWLLKVYMRDLIPLLTRVVARRKATTTLWQYYWDSINACVPPAEVLAALSAAGLSNATRYVEIGIFSEYQANKA